MLPFVPDSPQATGRAALAPPGPDRRSGPDERAKRQARLGRVPPQAFFGVSAVFHYLGPSLAVLLFARLDVLGVAWLRVASAALVFALWRRPWRSLRALGPGSRRHLLAQGPGLALANTALSLAAV